MMRLPRLLLALCAVGAIGACSTDGETVDAASAQTSDDSGVEVSLGVDAVVCVDPNSTCYEGEDKILIGVPHAEVRISSDGEELWSGTTGTGGKVDAEFNPDDIHLGVNKEWKITASSPALGSDVTGRTSAPVEGGALMMSMAFPGHYNLVPHG